MKSITRLPKVIFLGTDCKSALSGMILLKLEKMKNNIINLSYVLWIVFLSSCNSPKFYSNIIKMQDNIKNEIEKEDIVTEVRVKDFDFNRFVLKKMEKKLKNTNHIVFFLSS